MWRELTPIQFLTLNMLGILRVDVSIDDGRTWQQADLIMGGDQPRGRAWAWAIWECDIDVPSPTPIDVDPSMPGEGHRPHRRKAHQQMSTMPCRIVVKVCSVLSYVVLCCALHCLTLFLSLRQLTRGIMYSPNLYPVRVRLHVLSCDIIS
jgi:hypothetical protein